RRVGLRDFVQFLDEDRALGLKALDHVAVMDDFMAHIDGGAIFGEGELDDLDGALDAGAEAPRRGEIDGQRGTAGTPPIGLNRTVHRRLGEMVELAGNGPATRDSSLALSRSGATDSLTPIGGFSSSRHQTIEFLVEPGISGGEA